jgi:hypothetical protein
MARTITVTFGDKTQHVYQDVPDDVNPQSVINRAQKEFSKPVTNVDGGRAAKAAPAAPAAPMTKTQQIDAAIKSPGFAQRQIGDTLAAGGAGLLSALSTVGLVAEQGGANTLNFLNLPGGVALANEVQRLKQIANKTFSPAMAEHPVASTLGSMIAVGPVVNAVAEPFNALKATKPIYNAMTAGRTGLVPTAAAVRTGAAAAPTLTAQALDLAARGAGGAVQGATAATMTNPDDIGAGTVIGALIPTAGVELAKGVGNKLAELYDFAKGTGAGQRAADVIRKASGAALAHVIDVLKNARPDDTVRQALARAGMKGKNIDTLLALGGKIEKGAGASEFGAKADAATAAAKGTLAAAAGGANDTAARQAAEAKKFALNTAMRPELDENLARANAMNKQGGPLKTEAERQRRSEVKLSDIAAAYEPLAQRAANNRQVLGAVGPNAYSYEDVVPSNFAGVLPKPQAQRLVVSPSGADQETLNKFSVEAGRLEQARAAAERGSAAAGEAARTAESKIAALEAEGLKPLNVTSVIGKLRGMARQVGDRADPLRRGTFNTLADLVEQLQAENGGIMDAEDLYTIRKTTVNVTIKRLLEEEGSVGAAARARTASLLSQINPLIDEALENAGAKGWKPYLDKYASGMREIERGKMAAVAAKLYRDDPSRTAFVNLMEGNNEAAVEDIFGAGSYDIIRQMAAGEGAPSRLPAMQEIAADVRRGETIATAAERGAHEAQRVLEKQTSIPAQTLAVVGRRLLPKIFIVDDFAKALTAQSIDRKVEAALVKAFQSGKNASDMLALVPTKDRIAATRVLGNSKFWTTAGVVSQVQPKNAMAPTAPSSVNAMGQ